jgi:hypothetical protein
LKCLIYGVMPAAARAAALNPACILRLDKGIGLILFEIILEVTKRSMEAFATASVMLPLPNLLSSQLHELRWPMWLRYSSMIRPKLPVRVMPITGIASILVSKVPASFSIRCKCRQARKRSISAD